MNINDAIKVIKYEGNILFECGNEQINMKLPSISKNNLYEIECIHNRLCNKEEYLTMYEAVMQAVKYLLPSLSRYEITKQVNDYSTRRHLGFKEGGL